MLSLGVVLWGAGYKMEQYPQQGCAFRMMAPAKLLTEEERPVSARNLPVARGSAGQLPPLRILPAWSACPLCLALETKAPETVGPAFRRSRLVFPELNYFCFRPPPAPFTS
jgi:hypothetical protein